MDEKIDDEAQVCRLCGQFESIYIDVFGEEGSKRLLGLKIHSKINILIEKNDGLPQAICIRCVGTLEYFVDFQKDCQDTQARLWKEFQERENGFKIGVKTPEIEATSNKENDSSLNSGEATEQIVNLKRKAQPSIESPKCKEKKTLSVSQSDNCESKKLKIDDNVEENQLSEKILSEIPVNKLDKKLSAHAKGFQRLFGNTKIQKKNLPVVGKSRKLLQQKVDEKIELKKKINVEKKGENSSDKLTEIKQESNLDESVAEKISPEIESCQLSPVSNKKYSSAKKLDNKEIKLEKSRNSSEPTSQSNSTNEKPTPSISKKITDPQVSTSTEKNIQKSEEEQSIDNENFPKRRKYGSYGKLSDLISQEEKEKIEEHYKIDMSVINGKKVEENISLINDKTIECKICNKKYGRLDKCQVHIWSHFEMKPYKCTECNFATVTVTNIRCHIRKCHLKLKPFTCDICSNKYGTSLSLDEHMNTHTGHKPFSCNYCDYKSASRTVLKYHLSSHKTTKDITCDICKSKFYSKSRLRAHIVTHTKDKNLMCKYCSHYFSTIEGVNKHYKNVHSKDYACPYCDKVTKTKKALNNHLNVHSEAKFKCHLCTNVYKSGHILKEHLLKHEGIRKYKCDVCDKSFAQQSHLAAHKAVHSDKRFSCPGCQRNFNRHDNMKSHAKRCDAFLADPSLMEILNRRSKKLNIKREDEKEEFKKENQPGSVGDDLLNNGLGKIGDSAGREDQENKNSDGKETVLLIDNQKRGIDGNCEKFVTESVIGIEAF